MAFVTANKGGENPLAELDDGVYDAEISGWTEVENAFYGQLFRPDQPEGENNQRNPHKTQYEIDLSIDNDGETVEAKVWANPTLGERAKLRKIVKAAGAWESDDQGNEGFDDSPDNMVGRKLRVLVQDGRIDSTGFLAKK